MCPADRYLDPIFAGVVAGVVVVHFQLQSAGILDGPDVSLANIGPGVRVIVRGGADPSDQAAVGRIREIAVGWIELNALRTRLSRKDAKRHQAARAHSDLVPTLDLDSRVDPAVQSHFISGTEFCRAWPIIAGSIVSDKRSDRSLYHLMRRLYHLFVVHAEEGRR